MLRKLKQHLAGDEPGTQPSPEQPADVTTAGTPSPHINERVAGGFLTAQLRELISGGQTLSVTEAYAQRSAVEPDVSIEVVAGELYGKRHHAHHVYKSADGEGSPGESGAVQSPPERRTDEVQKHADKAVTEQWEAIHVLSPEQLDQAKQYGKWGTNEPSELFLNVYAQALLALDNDRPLNGLVSPKLMGACGVVPLTIISVIPDIIQHYADVIVRAAHEIILATNFWEASTAGATIVDAIKELSRRVMERGTSPVILKLMYDRGNPSQVIEPHQIVPPKTYTGDRIKLPAPEDVPGVIMEVQNYHVPPVGTFHAKYMVADRKVALLNSNNIQDRVNVEMMIHVEGPIVQAFYDMALLSWSKPMKPLLPLVDRPLTYPDGPEKGDYVFGSDHPVLGNKTDLESSAKQARATIARHHGPTAQPSKLGEGRTIWDKSNEDEAERMDTYGSDVQAITDHLNTGTKISSTERESLPHAGVFKPVVMLPPHDPVPMALVNRAPRGKPGHGDTFVPQDQAWLAGFKFAKHNVFMQVSGPLKLAEEASQQLTSSQTPTFNATPVVHAALEACKRGVLVEIYADLGFNDEGELLPLQGGTNQMVVMDIYRRLPVSARKNLRWFWYTGKDRTQPLNAKDKSRNCHVKLMIVDGQIAIQGNGNQDTQSWFHSQEINLLLDSPLICREWRDAIDSNQNTKFYGMVDETGVWKDGDGNELPGAEQSEIPHGPMKSLVGVKGAIQRVRGEGGF